MPGIHHNARHLVSVQEIPTASQAGPAPQHTLSSGGPGRPWVNPARLPQHCLLSDHDVLHTSVVTASQPNATAVSGWYNRPGPGRGN